MLSEDDAQRHNCLFCKIVKRQLPAHIIYEDKLVMVFLDIYPNKINAGQCLIVPKKHYNSYFANHSITDYCVKIARKIAKQIDRKLGSIRTCLVFEGMEIDHLHVKLYPIYKETYLNFLSTKKDNNNKGVRMTDKKLAELAKKIKLQEII